MGGGLTRHVIVVLDGEVDVSPQMKLGNGVQDADAPFEPSSTPIGPQMNELDIFSVEEGWEGAYPACHRRSQR